MFADTHAHLTDEAFEGRLESVINDFKHEGVNFLVNVGYDIASSKKSAYIAQKHDEIVFTAGLHPTDGEEATENNLAEIYNLAKSHEKCVGIGEIGLDYHYSSDRERQMKSFIAQLDLAAELSIPVSVHARDCCEDMLSVIKVYAPKLPDVVLHCYSLGHEAAKQFVKFGCSFAFGGAITFKNNKQIFEVAKVVPTDRLLTETDCPYMAPVPHRGDVNEPKYIPLIAEKLSELYGIEFNKMQEILFANAERVFKGK